MSIFITTGEFHTVKSVSIFMNIYKYMEEMTQFFGTPIF